MATVVTPPAEIAEPTAEAPKKRGRKPREGVEKVFHPALAVDENGKATAKLESAEAPEGYDSSVHSPLRADDFAGEHLFMRYRASKLEAKAAALRSEANVIEKLGTDADRKKAKTLVKYTQQLAELRAALSAKGVDVDELLAATGAAND